MADISAWSQTAAGNNRAVPDYPPEGMDRQDLNDNIRENQSGVRRWYEEPQWVDLLKEGGTAADFTVSKVDATNINIVHDVTPTDATAKFPVGARIRLDDGVTKLVGFVVSTAYAAPNTNVEVDIDGGTDVQAGVNKAERHVAGGAGASATAMDMGRAAWSPIGLTIGQDPPQVVKIDDVSQAGFVTEMNKATGVDVDKLGGSTLADILAVINERSSIVNGGFSCWQRGLTIDQTTTYPNDNAAYCADQWVLLMGVGTTHPVGGSGVVDLTRDGTSEVAGGYALKVTGNASVASPTAEKVGFFQMLTREASARFKNQNVSVSFFARIASGSTFNKLQVAILEWQGTADDPSSIDPINDWKGPGVQPTVIAQYTITSSVGAGGFTPTTSLQEFKLENQAVSASMENLGVLIWIDDQSWSAGAIAFIKGVSLSVGAAAHSYSPVDEQTELRRCEYFFESTFEPTEEPQQNLGDIDSALQVMGTSNGDAILNWDFRTPKFKVPTIVAYNPNAANALVRNQTGSDTAIVTTRTSKRKVSFETATGADANDLLAVHASAEAVLS